jgi:hypothetical protein
MLSSLFAPLLAINVFSSIPWTLLFLITQLFGVRLYYIKKSDECNRIQNRLKRCSHTTDGGKGFGYSCGYWYILHISSDHDDNKEVRMIATADTYMRLTEEIKEDDKSLFEQGWKPPAVTDQTKITVFERSGSYSNFWFRQRQREAKDIPRGQQGQIVSSIIDDYMKRRHTVAYIHGKPGTGKSMVGILVANEFSSSFCNTFKPWQPGDTLGSLISEVEPTPQKPLVIVFDEIDMALTKIHNGIPPHKHIPIAVEDKSGWNHMLDSIQRGMYPNMILIITSNRGPEFIEALDPSYIRKQRVDLTFEMTESLANMS